MAARDPICLSLVFSPSRKSADPSDVVTQVRCFAIFDRRTPAYAMHLSSRILPRSRQIFPEGLHREAC
ncbi:hypothetical protein BGY98DRAFT_1001764, partial [Russula aff. rugulosa BPL654]